MDGFESLAPEILRKFGADFKAAKRAGGWTNRVWIAGDLVLRISPDVNGDRIRREAALGMRLPKAVGYPEILETGVRDGHEWSVSRRVPGVNLGEAWPGLDWARRAEAMRGLWEIAEAVHIADLQGLPFALPRRTWYSDLRPETAHADLRALSGRGALEKPEAEALSGILDAFFDALERAEPCLCHGDLTMENMMWDGEGIASVFDFEHAALLPAQADVYSFLRMTLGPGGEKTPAEFAGGVAGLARARVRNADEANLLLGFAALISIRHMDIWDGPEPRLCLASLADGRGGFLAPVTEAFLG
jgi:scyllo-inosamine 4-kinase